MRLIRKQKNRRLYDTVARSNVTLAEVAQLIGAGESVRVEDSDGTDITRSVLLQIVMEHESPGAACLSQGFLENLVRLYNNPVQSLVANYLDSSLAVFDRQQAELGRQWRAALEQGGAPAVMAAAAEEGMRSWVGLQRALFDAWVGRAPGQPETPQDQESPEDQQE